MTDELAPSVIKARKIIPILREKFANQENFNTMAAWQVIEDYFDGEMTYNDVAFATWLMSEEGNLYSLRIDPIYYIPEED